MSGSAVIVVAGGKGGVGTTTVAALLAVAAAVAGRRTLVVDGDGRVGALQLMFGAVPRSLGELRGGALAAVDLVTPIAATLHVAPGAAADVEGVPPAEARALGLRVAELYDGYELVVVDAGSSMQGVLGACAQAEARGGQLMVVTTGDTIAAAAGYALLKLAAARYPTLEARVVANRHDDRAGADALASSAASHFLGREAPVAIAVPDDALLARAVGAGMTVQDAADGSPAAHAVADATLRLLDQLTHRTNRAARPAHAS